MIKPCHDGSKVDFLPNFLANTWIPLPTFTWICKKQEITFLKEQLVILQQIFTLFSTSQVSGNIILLENINYICGVEFFLKKINHEFWNYLLSMGASCSLISCFNSSISQIIMSQVILAHDTRIKIQGLPSPGSDVEFLSIFCNIYYLPAPYETNQECNFFLEALLFFHFSHFKFLLRLLV